MAITTIATVTTYPLTIEWIERLILQGSQTMFIRSKVAEFANSNDRVKAFFDWVWQNIDYKPDPETEQNLKSVEKIIETKEANCANYTILLGAYLHAIGERFCLRTSAYDEDKEPTHIYIVSRGVVLDLTAGQSMVNGHLEKTTPQFGAEFPNKTYYKDYCFNEHAVRRKILNQQRSEYFRKQAHGTA